MSGTQIDKPNKAMDILEGWLILHDTLYLLFPLFYIFIMNYYLFYLFFYFIYFFRIIEQ
jgi:hypothetical protein